MRWGRRRAESRPSATDRTPQAETSRPGLLVEEYDRLLLLRRSSDELLGPADIADLTRVLEADGDDTVTVVASADGNSAAALWARLGALIDTLCGEGVRTIRLAMPGAGDDLPGRPAVARRIADAWDVDVIAPDGTVLGVPGGGLFVHDVPPADGTGGGRERGWWRFTPGAPPVPLGPRQPAPNWQPAPGSLPSRTRNGCVVEQIPAGLLIRPEAARAPRPGDLCYAVPVDRHGILVVVGVPDGEDVVSDDVADVVTALPAATRTVLRFAPGGRRDVLRVGQDAAELADSEVVVYSGLPLLAEAFSRDHGTARSMTVGADGAPRWQPFVDSVICAPGAASPRLLRWSPPLPGPGNAQRGVVRLSDRWQVTATRAGLWISATDAEPPALAARPVDPQGPDIEVGRPGDALDRSLWPVLDRLLDGLPPGLSARARVHVHGTAVDGGRELRRLAAQYEVRSLRFASFGRAAPAAPHPAAPRNGSAGHPAPSHGTPRRETAGVGPGAAPHTAVPRVAGPPDGTGMPAGSPAGTPVPTGPTSTGPGASAAAASGVPAADPRAAFGTVSGGTPAPQGPRVPAPVVPPTPPRPVATSTGTGSASTGGPAVGGPPTTRVPAPPVRPATGQASTTGAASTASAPPGSGSAAAGRGASAPRPARASGTEPHRPPDRPAPAAPSPSPTAPVREPGQDGAGPRPALGPDSPARVPTEPARVPTEPARVPTEPVPEPPSAPASEPPSTPAPEAPSTPPAEPRQPRQPGDEATTGTTTTEPEPEPSGNDGGRDAGHDEQPLPGPPSRPTLTSTVPSPAAERRPRTDEPPTAPARPAETPLGPPPTAPARPLPPVPFVPGHQSTPAERAAFRALADSVWDRHAAIVTRTFTRLPALRGHEQEAARADLIALLLYLRTSDDPLGHGELDRRLRAGDPELLPYAACVTSALRRLPSFRGPVLRGAGPDGSEGRRIPGPGAVLRGPAPLSALPPGDGRGPSPASARYAIWSVTGRRVRQLSDATGPAARHDEVVFAPGTAFRVLDVRTGSPSPLVFLRELPAGPAPVPLSHARLDDQDHAVLARLDETLTRQGAGAGAATFDWPDRCAGPVGSPDH
ncbi:hypothetical protein [Streptomyces sp. CRN 30]|uniref:hypothetical protein n=1 Tax=Streptomyces sp. CRN 30 TaxID=3075613 RepID=UPI002A7F950E|nr:hypothetical protein [Streptomyces sp. CRN 30]